MQLCIASHKLWAAFTVAFISIQLEVVSAAEQTKSVSRIAYLGGASASSDAARTKALLQRLRELGYIEGKNLVIEHRFADGKLDRLPQLAIELVKLKTDVIVTSGPLPTRAARAAMSTIPIVMTNEPDPVANGFAVSLARPGGNITGLSTFAPELSGKRLQVLREVLPNLSRLAVLGTSTLPGYTQVMKELERAAKALKVQVQFMDILNAEDIELAFEAATKARADAVLTINSGILGSERARFVQAAAKHQLPAMFHDSRYVEAGGLMCYGVNVRDLAGRAAHYVDKILKGAKPADLPVEQPTTFELVVNMKTAKTLGINFPPTVTVRIDRLIE